MSTPASYRVAIVGAAGLKGRELKDVLSERNFPAVDLKLLDDDDALGQLDSVEGETTFIQSIRPGQFAGMDFTFFASEPEFTAGHWKEARRAGNSIIDLSYALENEPGVALRSPWVERELGGERKTDLAADAVVAAHPAATILALLLLRAAQAAKIERVIANLFEPVSERGRRGMDELHQQTVNLLSFQQLPKGIFDAQVAFNLLPRYGPAAGASLSSVGERIQSHLRQITAGRFAPPSLALLHAPIFHGYASSVYIELAGKLAAPDLERALAGAHVTLAPLEGDAPSNVSVAGEENIVVSVRPESGTGRANAFWLWAAADNLKLSALTAVECAAALALTRSRGTVQ